MAASLHRVRTRKASIGSIAHQLTIGEHVILSDAAVAAGGEDLGPDPHELLDAALASCTALMPYARRKGWRLESVEVEVSHDEVEGVYRMRRGIRLVGGLDADERGRLLEIANKCPLHRTLSGRFVITSTLIDWPAAPGPDGRAAQASGSDISARQMTARRGRIQRPLIRARRYRAKASLDRR